jgi:predicted nucleic acid-binding protein
MIVVSNTTPLIGLASIGRFDLLHAMFGEITIAQAVYDETVVAGRTEGGAKREGAPPPGSRPSLCVIG